MSIKFLVWVCEEKWNEEKIFAAVPYHGKGTIRENITEAGIDYWICEATEAGKTKLHLEKKEIEIAPAAERKER